MLRVALLYVLCYNTHINKNTFINQPDQGFFPWSFCVEITSRAHGGNYEESIKRRGH